MTDKAFGVLMALVATVLVVGMSTPLTASTLLGATSRLVQQIAPAEAPASIAVAGK